MRVIILTFGWVLVGQPSRRGDVVTITSAQVVRRWGTTAGIGQLAAEGPSPNTRLEPVGVWETDALHVLGSIPCNPEAWPEAGP